MGLDSYKACCEAVRQRNLPKLIQSDKNENGIQRKTTKDSVNGKKETSEERVIRISQTSVSVKEFWYECLDWEMLKLFFALLMLFFCVVGFVTLVYLIVIFNFKENLWYFYFPVSKREEL